MSETKIPNKTMAGEVKSGMERLLASAGFNVTVEAVDVEEDEQWVFATFRMKAPKGVSQPAQAIIKMGANIAPKVTVPITPKTTGKCETCGKEKCELEWVCKECGNPVFYVEFCHGHIYTICDFCGDKQPPISRSESNMEENQDYFAPVVNAAGIKPKTGIHNERAYYVLRKFWGVNMEVYADRVIKLLKQETLTELELEQLKKLGKWIYAEAHILVEGWKWHDEMLG